MHFWFKMHVFGFKLHVFRDDSSAIDGNSMSKSDTDCSSFLLCNFNNFEFGFVDSGTVFTDFQMHFFQATNGITSNEFSFMCCDLQNGFTCIFTNGARKHVSWIMRMVHFLHSHTIFILIHSEVYMFSAMADTPITVLTEICFKVKTFGG